MQNVESIKHKGIFRLEHFRNGEKINEDIFSENLIVIEGKNYLSNSAYNNVTAAQPNWFVALYGNNVAPSDTLTGANVASILGELNTEVSEATRPVWVPNGSNTGASSSNSEAVAVFTMTQDDTVYGAFFVSNSTKAGTTGTLLAASAFSPSRSVQTNDVLQLTYEIQLT